MKEQYFIQVEDENVKEAKETHAEFYDSVEEAIDDSHMNGTPGMTIRVRRVSDNKLMKKEIVRCLN